MKKQRKPASQKLHVVKIENESGWSLKSCKNQIPLLRKGKFKIINISTGGDAPKDFICLYDFVGGRKKKRGKRAANRASPSYCNCNRSNHHKWTKWIAKVGHKWHPIESVMEFLLNRIGEVLGLRMAQSRLMSNKGQLRFLSRYFLKKGEQLIHGAEIYSGFLSDTEFVEEVERRGLARDLFTFQFAKLSFESFFPLNHEQLIEDFVRLVVFDAIVGNNDRHFFNWGVVTKIDGAKLPQFSPIYDSARGLYWNSNESKINVELKLLETSNSSLLKYVNNSLPKTGWEGESKINHFRLVELLANSDNKFRLISHELCNFANEQKIYQLIDHEFRGLLSPNRIALIKRCLEARFQTLYSVI